MRCLFWLALALASFHSFADTDPLLTDVPFPPSFENGAAAQSSPPPEPSDKTAASEQEELAPEITVIQYAHATIAEYRVKGRLIMVKITPAIGYPYYLFDHDGDGRLERTQETEDERPSLNQWRLFSW